MKQRNGFVSNSSSASFIVSATINDIAPAMFKTMIDDFNSWSDNRTDADKKAHKAWKNNLKKALKRRDVLSGKIGIVMPSCNYNTYMIEFNHLMYIKTSRNHNWDFDYIYSAPEIDGVKEVIVDAMIKPIYFYDIRNNKIHSPTIYDDLDGLKETTCNNCNYFYGYVVDKNGNKYCGHCFNLLKIKKKTKPKKIINNIIFSLIDKKEQI